MVGDDFPESEFEFWKTRGIDARGVQRVQGKTFRWSGEYAWDLNTRETRSVALNVFENFQPQLPDDFRDADFVLLANIAPALQATRARSSAASAFCHRGYDGSLIDIARRDLEALLPRVDLLILNDSEARQITGDTSLIRAGRAIRRMGPRFVAVKKGEHGALLFGPDDFFSCGAYPLEDIHDPTGAGDTFAGGLAGFLAGRGNNEIDFGQLRRAVIFGSVLASFNVEAFSLERLRSLTNEEIDERYQMFRLMSQFEVIPDRGNDQFRMTNDEGND